MTDNNLTVDTLCRYKRHDLFFPEEKQAEFKVRSLIKRILEPEMLNSKGLHTYFCNDSWALTTNRAELCSYEEYKSPLDPEEGMEFEYTELSVFNLNARTYLRKYTQSEEDLKIYRYNPITWNIIKSFPVDSACIAMPGYPHVQELHALQSPDYRDTVKHLRDSRQYNTSLIFQIKIGIIWSLQCDYQKLFGLAPNLEYLAELNSQIENTRALDSGTIIVSMEPKESLFGPITRSEEFKNYDLDNSTVTKSSNPYAS